MRFTVISQLVASLALYTNVEASKLSSKTDLIQFDNVGYEGYYYPVSKIEALSDGNCSCAKDLDNPFTFSGPLAPLDEELTVHFRGPMNLKKFAYYVSSSYETGQTTGSWDRLAYYDADEGTADNVTFLANYGTENACLGNAAYYVSSDGLEKANSPQILENTTIPSALEFAIASGIKCNGTDDCGAYRSDCAPYHGFYGVNKMFLFEFNAPADTSEEHKVNKTDGYDMPAIWLLNAHILRTSQYPTNGNCSSWNTGSGEFDIFEVMNYTERNNFYSTIHDYQGIDDIGTGIQNFGYLERTPDATMKGGVVFGEDKTITVFLSNSTSLNSTIDNSDLNDWMSVLEKESESIETLTSITILPPSTTEGSTETGKSSSTSVGTISSTSKHKNDAVSNASGLFGSLLSIALGFLYV